MIAPVVLVLLAFVPAQYLVGTGSVLQWVWMALLFVGIPATVFLIFSFPAFVYFDLKRSEGLTDRTSFGTAYVFAGIVGYVVPLLQQVTGVLYLYNTKRASADAET